MKKKYMTPKMDVVVLKQKTALLVGSPNTISFSKNSEFTIDDSEDIQ